MFKKHWAFFPWLESSRGKEIMSDITFLELVPIVLSIFLFRHELANKWIVFHTDDKALVSIFNKKSSKCRRVMQLVRPFVLQTIIHNMQFKARHIQGKLNCKANAISRKQFKTLKQLEPDADQQPMNIPKNFEQLFLEIRVITILPNSEQSYKGKVKTHKYINRQNQSTTGKM